MNFSVDHGSLVSILGPNGCEKTTLLRILAGLASQEERTITYQGISVPPGQRTREMARLVGFVQQGHQSIFSFSVLDMVLTGRFSYISPFRTPSHEDVAIATSCLDRVGGGYLIDRPYTWLSGGERQLVLIARALASQPQFLLLDEPNTYLDIKNPVTVLSLIQDLCKTQGITGIMTIHDPSHAAQFSDQILVMRKLTSADSTNLIADGTPDEVLSSEILGESFRTEIQVFTYNNITTVIPVIQKNSDGFQDNM